MAPSNRKEHARADAVAEKQREIQREQDQRERARSERGEPPKTAPMQAGARKHPVELPAQHLDKPGNEWALQLKPQFLAPDFEGSHKLRDKVALITGGDSGIGRAVAVLYAREGADVAIVYLNEHADAEDAALRRGRGAALPADPRRREGRRVLRCRGRTHGA